MKQPLLTTLFLLHLIVGFTACEKDENEPVQDASLAVTVKDASGNPVAGASVSIYNSKTNMDYQINAVASAISDGSGKVLFKQLSDIPYFCYAEKDCSNNIGEVQAFPSLTPGSTANVNTSITPKGHIRLKSTSSNPYRVYLNGTALFEMAGGSEEYLPNLPVGNYTIRVLQLSGYLLYPTDKTFEASVTCGNVFSITYP